MNLSDTDQAPYSAPAPQTATVSDEAVQAALDKWHGLPLSTEDAMRAALTAALPHLSQIVTSPVDVAAVRRQAFEEAKEIAFDISENGQYMGNGDCSGNSIYQQGATEVYDALCDLTSDISPAEPVPGEPDFSKSIAEVIKEESLGGAACGWKSCTGCLETNEGYHCGEYPYSEVFKTHAGSGCSECGRIGVVWEYYSKSDLDEMQRDPIPAEPVDQCDFAKADWFYRDIDPDDSGDSAHEAIVNHPEYSVHLIHSSYRGDSRYAFRAPTLNLDDDDDEVLHFSTEAEALSEAHKRKAEIEALNAAPNQQRGE